MENGALTYDALRTIPIFERLDSDDLDIFYKELKEHRIYFKKGDIIIRQDDKQTFAGLLASDSGTMQRLRNGVLVDTLPAGHNFGFFHLLEEHPAFATIKAVADGSYYCLSAEAFGRMTGENAHLHRSLLASTLRTARAHMNVIRSLITANDANGGSSASDIGVGCPAAVASAMDKAAPDMADAASTAMMQGAAASVGGVTPPRRAPKKDISVPFFDASAWTRAAFSPEAMAGTGVRARFVPQKLSVDSAPLAAGSVAISCFVNDDLSADVLRILSLLGVRMIALRCAGFDRVAIPHAKAFGITIARVPVYSPDAVAEHAVALLMSGVRKLHVTGPRMKMGSFSLDGLIGFNLRGKVVGVVGTGKIGQCFGRIMAGFGSKMLCYDPMGPAKDLLMLNDKMSGGADGERGKPGQKKGDAAWEEGEVVRYVSDLSDLWPHCDVISLHVPLLDSTRHMINDKSLEAMKAGVVLINVSRGGLIDTEALIKGLKQEHVRVACLDVFEGEEAYVFSDSVGGRISDDRVRSLLSLPNVVLSGHQAFLTDEALEAIRATTVENVHAFVDGQTMEKHPNSVYK
eukprot:TRINITY_DN2576_c0_g1_i1.p1 TRINITY_DN2576_c0_g1~~TRINITY_DN2576_c0_g1_i1.p1  ORF type:complete len:574 (+),score=137.09 TRINITY_DN2576_c0_g1_i1:156-1877(+)